MSDAALGLFATVAAIPAPDLTDPAVAEFAEQFALDVAAVDDGQRAAFFAATGDQAFAVVQRIYAHDLVPRVRSVLEAVLGHGAPSLLTLVEERGTSVSKPTEGLDTWPLLESFMVEIARLRSLDPVLTELVRLRGARLHNCALCRSRRSQDAIDAGAGDAEFAAVDDWATSDLPDDSKAALALTDAVILTPYDVPDATVAAARTHLDEQQIVEVVLDVMRNAANKIAVALGADAPQVTEGVELFVTDDNGNLSVVGVG